MANKISLLSTAFPSAALKPGACQWFPLIERAIFFYTASAMRQGKSNVCHKSISYLAEWKPPIRGTQPGFCDPLDGGLMLRIQHRHRGTMIEEMFCTLRLRPCEQQREAEEAAHTSPRSVSLCRPKWQGRYNYRGSLCCPPSFLFAHFSFPPRTLSFLLALSWIFHAGKEGCPSLSSFISPPRSVHKL